MSDVHRSNPCPELSIIVPAYNAEDFILQCLKSISEQQFADFECIIVNDGSTDGTLSVIEAFIKNDKRFSLVTQKNGGPASARNRGLEVAKGRFIGFCDSDDALLPDHYSSIIDLMKSCSADIGISAYYKKENREDERIGKFNKIMTVEQALELIASDTLNSFFPTKVFCRNVFGTLRFNEQCTVMEDVELMHKIFMNAHTVAYTGNPTYYYRQNPNSILHTVDLECEYKMLTVFEGRCTFFSDHGREDLARLAKIRLYQVLVDFLRRSYKQKQYVKDHAGVIRNNIWKAFCRSPFHGKLKILRWVIMHTLAKAEK